MAVSPQDAAKYLLRLKKAQTSFREFVHSIYPDLTWADFHYELMDALDALERGTLTNDAGEQVTRLLITMPPRHGKSFLATITFPVYYLAKNPVRNVLSTSYNQDLAKTFGRQVRDLAREPIVSQAFSDFGMSEESKAVDDWRTTLGGSYYATGMGGSTTGRAATLLLVDDPVKAREEADSATQRNKTWSYYVSALTTRKQPEPDGRRPIEIVILTRWHPDDLAGRIKATEDWAEGSWKHINFPAIRQTKSKIKRSVVDLPAEDPRHVPQGQISKVAPGKRHYYPEEETALWPDRFPLEELKKRERLDPREFASLYQQSPYVQGGNLIKQQWWKSYDEPPHCPTVIISCDTAFKKTETSDYSVMMTIGMDQNGDIFVLDVIRQRYDFPELKRAAITHNAKWRGRGLRGLYVEDKASGQSLIQELRAQSGMAVIAVKVGSDKVSRVNAVLPLIEGGRVFIPAQAQWLDDFMDEAQSFPSGKHDDMVDALSMGLDQISRMGGQASEMLTGPISAANSLNAQFQQSTPANWWGSSMKNQPHFKGWGEL